MKNYPINDLNKCSVRFCEGITYTIIVKKIGQERIMFGYCEFHSMISAQFKVRDRRRVIPFTRMHN